MINDSFSFDVILDIDALKKKSLIHAKADD